MKEILLARRPKDRGFTLVEIMITLVLVSILGMAAGAIFYQNVLLVLDTTDMFAHYELKSNLLDTLANPDLCSCQFNPSLSTDDVNDSNLVIDSTDTSGNQAISLNRLRNGCALSDTIIAEVNENIGNRIKITSMQLTELTPTGAGNTWKAVIDVALQNPIKGDIGSVKIGQFFELDAASIATDPTQATIDRCLGVLATGGGASADFGIIASCPPGYEMIGDPNGIGTFCIETNERPADTFFNAMWNCGQNTPAGYGVGKLCRHTEFYAACTTGTQVTNMTNGSGEWTANTDGYAYGAIDGIGACNEPDYEKWGPSYTFPYRCCLR